MIILGIESSCDETAAAVVKDGRIVLGSAVSSQIPLHQPYMGVVPELASRAHVENINAVIELALKNAYPKASYPWKKIDAIGVTVAPGLVGALLVGRMTAEALGLAWNKPVVGVNHIEGHLYSPILHDDQIRAPFLGLVVSGGHTELLLAKEWGSVSLLGATRDDAAGEAFDKVAKMLKLGYPGGPIIDRLAKKGDAANAIFPRAWLPGTWDFSFSGLKTSVLYLLDREKKPNKARLADLCSGFQEAVVDVLVGKTIAAARAAGVKTIVVGGGVAANSRLRQKMSAVAGHAGFQLSIAEPRYCTDNASMIAAAAYFKVRRGIRQGPLRVSSQSPFPRFSGRVSPFTVPSLI